MAAPFQQNKESVLIYSDQIASLLELDSMKDLKAILEMIRLYGINGEEVECPKHLRPIWVLFKGSIDRNAQAYNDYIDSKKSAGKSGYAKMMANKAQQCPAVPSSAEQSPAVPSLCDCVCECDNNILSLPNGSESNARAHAKSESFKLTEYPETAEDVLAISQAINTPMSQEQAQAYIDNRIRADWHQGIGGTGRKIKMEAIPADIRLWVDRDKAEQNRNRATTTEREAKRNATAGSFGRYVPKN